MAKNIEININTNGTTYEALYPTTGAGNIKAGTFSGNFTFMNVPSCSSNPSGANHLVRKGWVDSQSYATQTWVNGKGYATTTWVNSQLSSLSSTGDGFIEFKAWTGTGATGGSHVTINFPVHSGYKIAGVLLGMDSGGRSDNDFLPLGVVQTDRKNLRCTLYQSRGQYPPYFSVDLGSVFTDEISLDNSDFNVANEKYTCLAFYSKE